MPARDIHFTFNTNLKVNKITVLQFVKEFEDIIRENFQEIKKEFQVEEINQEFLKMFIKELKGFDNVSIDEGDVHGKQKIIKDFIYDILGSELKEPTTLFGIRYLYDKWDYEGCGYDDYYYLTYTDDKKMIKKFIKEAEEAVDKLKQMGVNVNFTIE